MQVQKHLELLGMECEDKVTGVTGIITSIGFDLYGCVQAIVNRGIDKDGELRDQRWFDVTRLKIIGKAPVMIQPNFEYGDVAEGKKGATDKPAMSDA